MCRNEGKAGFTKTLDYSYDDCAVALLAKELGDEPNYAMLMKRSQNYKNMFDPSTGLMRGRLENGDWIKNFNPQYPYQEYMYREANAWGSSFIAPHDTAGLIGLYKSNADFEQHLDSLFTSPRIRIKPPKTSTPSSGSTARETNPTTAFPISTILSGSNRSLRLF